MGAFIVAGIAFIITVVITIVTLWAAEMSETGLDGPNPWVPLISGTVISGLIAASHWMPNIGW